jgi:hypothetical protein
MQAYTHLGYTIDGILKGYLKERSDEQYKLVLV